MKKRLFLIVTVISFISCSEKEIDMANLVERNGKVYEVNSEKPYSGKIIKKNGKGQFIITGHFDKGLKDGEWKEYYNNGQKSLIENYSKGKLNGDFEKFYKNGKPSIKGKYLNDEYDGMIVKWNQKGTKISEIEYSKGILDGILKEYDNNGSILKDFNYKNGVKNGLCVLYFSNNKKQIEANYSEGKLNGQYKEWYRNGQIKKEINYKMNKIKKESYWNSDGSERPSTKNLLKGKWYSKTRNGDVWVFNLDFKNNNRVLVEEDRLCNGCMGFYAQSTGTYNILNFNEFEINYYRKDYDVNYDLKFIIEHCSKNKIIARYNIKTNHNRIIFTR